MVGKKGELMGLPFILILSVVLIAFILVTGSILITRWINFNCEVENNKKVSDIKGFVDNMYFNDGDGSQRVLQGTKFQFCSNVQYVCFYNPGETKNIPTNLTIQPQLKDKIKVRLNDKNSNVLLITDADIVLSAKLEYLKTSGNMLCVKNKDKIKLEKETFFIKVT